MLISCCDSRVLAGVALLTVRDNNKPLRLSAPVESAEPARITVCVASFGPLPSGPGVLRRPRPLVFLLGTGSGYVGYEYYRTRERQDGAPPRLASHTQVRGLVPPDERGFDLVSSVLASLNLCTWSINFEYEFVCQNTKWVLIRGLWQKMLERRDGIESLVESEVVLSVLVLVLFEGPAFVLDFSNLWLW